MDPLALVVVVVLIVVAAAASFVRGGHHRDAVLSPISAATGGSHRGEKGSATLGANRFDYELVSQGRYAPPGVLVSIPIASGARFQVKKKDFDSKVFHAIGLSELRGTSVGVLTGDAAFDDRFFLVCDSMETGRRIFSSPDNRDAVRRIFEHGYNVLKYDGTRVAARVSAPSAEQFNPGVVTRVVPFLADLATSIRENARPPLPADPFLWHRPIAIAAVVLFAIAAGVALLGYRQYQLLDDRDFALASLSVTLPVAALLALVALRVSKGPLLHAQLVGALLALPLIGWWGGGWLNCYLDRGPPTVHVALVVDKYMTGDYPYTSYVTLASWRPKRRDVDLRHEQLFGVVQTGRSLVAVTTMPGFFGFEWIISAVNQGPAPGRELPPPARK